MSFSGFTCEHVWMAPTTSSLKTSTTVQCNNTLLRPSCAVAYVATVAVNGGMTATSLGRVRDSPYQSRVSDKNKPRTVIGVLYLRFPT